MPESSNINRKESPKSFTPSSEVVLYSFSGSKKPSVIEKVMNFFQPKESKHSIQKSIDFPEFNQPLEITTVANTITTPAFSEELAAQHPKITQAVKIITTDIRTIRQVQELAKDANIPNSDGAVIHAIEEQFNREKIKGVEVSLGEEKVSLKFTGEITQTVHVIEPEI